MKKTIYNTFIRVTSQEQCDRLKQICIDNGLPIWDSPRAFEFDRISLEPILEYDFNNDFADATFDDFANTTVETGAQSFGSVSGSRVRYYDAMFRVRGTDTSQSGINVTAEFDTLFSDFNETFDGYTFEGFDSAVPGINFIDWSLIPLRTEPYISFNYLVLNTGELDINALGF
jgi:hypothetical protein